MEEIICKHGVKRIYEKFSFFGAIYVCICCGNGFGSLNFEDAKTFKCSQCLGSPTIEDKNVKTLSIL